MSKERIDSCLGSLSNLLKRGFSLIEKCEWIETLKLELVGVCFSSELLEKKIQALK
jgi:hypothetical protein